MKYMRMIVAIAVMASAAQYAVGQATTGRANEQQKRDQLRAAVQDICPVSGEKLGSMGDPIKVQVGKETVFLCCKGCMNRKIDPQHWATIHANAAKAQRICPVMKKGLPKNPKWTVVEGQIVYICCPGCDKKIVANPQKFLRAVDELYITALNAKRQVR